MHQHEGSKITDRTTRTRSVLLWGQCLIRSQARKQNVRRGLRRTLRDFEEKFQRVGKESLRFGRKPNPNRPPLFWETGVGWGARRFAYIFIFLFQDNYAYCIYCAGELSCSWLSISIANVE